MKRLLMLLIAFTLAAFGADINGSWKATAEGPNGNIERTFVFKVDGTRLTGETTSSMLGKSIINDGVIEGDTLSFTITGKLQGNEVKLSYKGKVAGEEIHLTSQITGGNGGQVIEWVAKRVLAK